MVIINTLENGVRVALEPMEGIRSAALGIWVRNGARDEPPELNGMSHFIEHMLFKGTSSRTAKQIADSMDAIGGQLNAYTAREYTAYYARVLDTHFGAALEILADMFFNSRFDAGEIAKERNVITEEISMYKDTPEDLAHDALSETLYPGDPLGASILGTPESIGAFKRGDFIEYIETHYTPDRIVVSAAGSLDPDAALEAIAKVFGSFRRRSVPANFPDGRVRFTPGSKAVAKDIEQLHLCVGFPGIPTGSPKTYDLAVLNTMLGGGMSSRLFQHIREDKGLVYSIYSYTQGFKGEGLLSVYAALAPENAPETLDLIMAETDKFRRREVGAKLLADTKEQIQCNYLMSLESSSTRMTNIGRGLLMLGRVYSPEEISRFIDAVTEESVKALANEILDPERVGIATVGKSERVLRAGMSAPAT
ncbi:MAG: insulinase family protein [Clostridiales bacterium]|jgi:predicted Zn-dependent peptidase|nr:insulinase family protein [Clostridiales bacterium]